MTLIELLIVIAISAILLAVGVPMFNSTIAGSKTAGAASDIRGALEVTRSEAIRRGTTVSVCRSTAPTAIPAACSNAAAGNFLAGDWSSGWVVFVDAGGAPGDANDPLILVQNSGSPGSRAVITGNVTTISFDGTGLRTGAAGTIGSFQISSNDPNSPRTRYICVGITGQIYGKTTACP